jgi:hypothetical protein
LWPLWTVLGLCGRSGEAFGVSIDGLRPLLGLCRLSWAALGAHVGGLGLLLGLCGRS